MPDRRDPSVRSVERIDDAREADERVLAHLAQLGCDESTPCESRHFLYLPERSGADAVAAALDGDGWVTSIEPCERVWLLIASRVRPLTPDAVRETRTLLEALASEQGGLYDGWEAMAG